ASPRSSSREPQEYLSIPTVSPRLTVGMWSSVRTYRHEPSPHAPCQGFAMALTDLTLLDARAALRAREVSAVELADAFLARIEAVDSGIHAFVTVTADLAREQARVADARRAAGEDTPLLGLPLALKDVLCTAGVRTTCSSRILENFVPPYSATVV